MELALLFVGIALTALRVVLPMIGWTISPLFARAIALIALALIVGSLGYILWQLRVMISTPIQSIYWFMELAEVRLFFIYASFLLLVLILVIRFVIRPLHRDLQLAHKALRRYVYPRH